MVPYKYALNLWQMPVVAVVFLVGVLLVLYGTICSIISKKFIRGIWYVGFAHNIDRDSVVLSRRLQQYGLLSIECRLASSLSVLCLVMSRLFHVASDVCCFYSVPLCWFILCMHGMR